MSSSDNKRIAKNTAMLYFRMIFLTLINIYCVRITLEALGVEDYGIYNVIGSAVWSLAILKVTMSSATQRFFSYHLGRNDYINYSKTFTSLLGGFIIIAIITIIIGEILGVFFLNSWLRIPTDRLFAAKYVYQLSLITVASDMIMIPYVSSIIANEKMSAFAIFSIIDGILKLVIVYILIICNIDKLILYGYLMLSINIINLIMHITYCQIKFKYCKYIWEWNKKLFKELSSYTGWNMIGSISTTLTVQGQNLLLNIFFGPIINAAKAIGDKIMTVINSFSANLFMAVTPQIIKSYAAGDIQRSINLVMRSSKISYLLLFILSFPLICNMDFILQIWLGKDSKTPDMVIFSQLMLIYCMVNSLEQPITRIIQAKGDIKKYQIYVGLSILSYLPIAALTLYLGGSAPITMIVLIIITMLTQFIRVYIAHFLTGLSKREYLVKVISPIFIITILSIPVYVVNNHYKNLESLSYNIISILTTFAFALLLSWFFGFNKNDKQMIYNITKKK